MNVAFKTISRKEWLPYMQERFENAKLTIKEEGVIEICVLVRDVPNSIQELCQWMALSGETGLLTPKRIHESLADLVGNKSSRYMEKLASLSMKEKKCLSRWLGRKESLPSPRQNFYRQPE